MLGAGSYAAWRRLNVNKFVLFVVCFCLVKIGKVNTFKQIFVYLMISVYNESLICDCGGAEILRPQHFVVVCELTSIHDDILSSKS